MYSEAYTGNICEVLCHSMSRASGIYNMADTHIRTTDGIVSELFSIWDRRVVSTVK